MQVCQISNDHRKWKKSQYRSKLVIFNKLALNCTNFHTSKLQSYPTAIECNVKGMNVFESISIKLPGIWVNLKRISHLEMKYTKNMYEAGKLYSKTNQVTQYFHPFCICQCFLANMIKNTAVKSANPKYNQE